MKKIHDCLSRACRRFLSITVFLFLLAYCGPPAANAWDLGLDGGVTVPTQNVFPTNTGDINVHSIPYFQALNTSPGGMVSLYGYGDALPWLKAGLVLGWDDMNVSAQNPVEPSQGGPQYGRTGLGNIETWTVLPSVRLHPWRFGQWMPFWEIDAGWSWNQWSVPNVDVIGNGAGTFSAGIADAFVVRSALGVDYDLSHGLAAEIEAGFQQSDPLGSVALSQGTGGMDQEFNLTFVFVQAGLHFGF